MSPFRERPVKWDGDTGNGRYKSHKGYKYDIVNKKVVSKAETLPRCLLADTPEEAEAMYAKFERLLNDFAYSYAASTGVSRSDLFGEAVIGLARAYRDWDSSRSDNFRAYAKFRIRDALNEFVASNKISVAVPSYVKKAYSNLHEIKSICEAANVNYLLVAEEQELPAELTPDDAVRCACLVRNLLKAAERANVEYKNFVRRISLMPSNAEYVDHTPPEVQNREFEKLEAAMVVEGLRDHMDDVERVICDGIMMDRSYDDIGKELGKSKAWVADKVKNFRERIISMLEDGTL